MSIELIASNVQSGNVSIDTLNEFESAILSDKSVTKAGVARENLMTLLFFLDKCSRRAGINLLKTLKSNYIKSSTDEDNQIFTIMMGIDYFKLYPHLLFSKKQRSAYMFDAWPKNHDSIFNLIEDFKMDHIFFSSSQVAAIFNKRLNKGIAHWIPEAIDPYEYKQLPYEEKTIDILALGRRYELYHEKIQTHFDNSDRIYLYEKTKGQLIFPSRKEFIEGLAKSKISICVPSNITHPERSGDIETMTVRYLQSIASKCLIVGHAPKEMIELFGYNPVIEMDINKPVEQLDAILDNYNDYMPLIEKNYEAALNNHTWQHRWKQIKDILIKKKK